MENIVRDPIAVNEQGELICVGEVPENTALDILKGEPSLLIAAAELAAADCGIPKDKKARFSLIVDCISRVLFLEDKFPEELSTVRKKIESIDPNCVVQGILTLGEISSYGDGFLEFFNKTIVAGVFYE